MIRNKGYKLSFIISLCITIVFHLVTLFFVKKSDSSRFQINADFFNKTRPLRVDRIDLIKPDELERLKRVGIKNGHQQKYFEPDMIKPPMPSFQKSQNLSLGNLAPVISAPPAVVKKEQIAPTTQTAISSNLELHQNTSEGGGHFYFNPKKEKKISQSHEQDSLKQEVYKNVTTSASNAIAQKISNFEIRYERPEGVSEDQLNSDEKAYYAFFKRSYANYLTKLYATYDKVSVERPRLEKDFNNRHMLFGKIDYDEKGNIITIKILKSSDSDDVHYFFEETLKQLNLPNPPKSFIKNKKQFSTYYQIQIN